MRQRLAARIEVLSRRLFARENRFAQLPLLIEELCQVAERFERDQMMAETLAERDGVTKGLDGGLSFADQPLCFAEVTERDRAIERVAVAEERQRLLREFHRLLCRFAAIDRQMGAKGEQHPAMDR